MCRDDLFYKQSTCITLSPCVEEVVYIRLILEHLARKTYQIYIHYYPNSACTKNTFFVHALARQFCMYAKHFFRTRTREAILHVRKTHLAYGSVSVSVSIVQTGGSGTACTQNIPNLHTLEPQFCMYEKHFFGTHTREAIEVGLGAPRR